MRIIIIPITNSNGVDEKIKSITNSNGNFSKIILRLLDKEGSNKYDWKQESKQKGDKTMLDTLIQLNVLGFVAVAGYMTGDALVKMVKGSVEAGNRILPLVGNLLASLLLPVEEPTVEPTVEPIVEPVREPVYADQAWVGVNAVQWVTAEELDQQFIDEEFELTFSECANVTVIKPVLAKALKKVSDFVKIEGLTIEKVKNGYLLTVDEFSNESFRTLKYASKFIEQLMSEGLSLWSRV